MGSIKKYSIILTVFVVSVLVAFGYGRSTAPENVKEVEVIKEKKDTVYVTREITRPDGTKEKETRTEVKQERAKESSSEVVNKKPNYDIDILYGLAVNNKTAVYGLSVQKRITGNIKAGVWGTNEKQIGVSVGFEF